MRLSPRLLLAFAVLATALVVGPASAHTVGLSRGDYVVDGADVRAELTFARGESPEAGTTPEAFGRRLVDRVEVRGDDSRCDGAVESAATTEGDGVVVRARFTCRAPPSRVSIRAAFLEDLPAGHRHVARIAVGATTADELLVLAHAEATVAVGQAPRAAPSFLGFVRLGVEHILTGYDHLLFLVGLVVVGGRWRSIALVVTAFTAAHSITLGMAALGVWSPPPRIIEPLIALSIAYVGVENFFVRSAEKRWRITFPFGLVHGFGFAGALAEIRLARADVPRALLGFNLGVEVGQLAVLLVLLPALMLLRRREGFGRYGVRALSGAIVIVGLYWFVERVIQAQ